MLGAGVYTHEWGSLVVPPFPGAAATGGCEPSDVDAAHCSLDLCTLQPV